MLQLDDKSGEQVYAILAEECGAQQDQGSSRALTKEIFLNWWARGCEGNEMRFQGDLGFGGKVWVRTNRLNQAEKVTVNCYQEDQTPERGEMIERANARLKELGQREL